MDVSVFLSNTDIKWMYSNLFSIVTRKQRAALPRGLHGVLPLL